MLRTKSTATALTMTALLCTSACIETHARVDSASTEEDTEDLELDQDGLAYDSADESLTSSVTVPTCTTANCTPDQVSCVGRKKADLCVPECPCASGLGDCDTDLDCQAGLVCGVDNGPSFGLPSGWETCVPAHCANGRVDADLGEGPGIDCGGECGTCVNYARYKAAKQSSTCIDAGPERANDGETDGDFLHGSVSHTCNAGNEWWQVDLGSSRQVTEIDLWNRTDCCSERLSNYWVFLMTRDPGAAVDPTTLAASPLTRYSAFFQSGPDPTRRISVPAVRGRYVRILKMSDPSGDNWLHIAEVQVFGR